MIPYDALNFGFGWHKDVEEVARIVSENGIKSFSTTAPHLMDSAPTGPVILTKYMDKLWGKDKWIYNQGSCGSCVANGAGMAAEILVAEDVTDNGAENPGRLDCMSIYWGSRVEIGGGRLSGEGSVGAWAAQYLQKFGCLPRKKYQSVDLTEYSAALCCSGYARKGVPDDLEPTQSSTQSSLTLRLIHGTSWSVRSPRDIQLRSLPIRGSATSVMQTGSPLPRVHGLTR